MRCEISALVGHGIGHAQVFWKRKAKFAAPGLGDPSLLFHFLPGHVHFFGADERKHVVFLAVFPHQGGGQAQSSPGLEAGGHLKYRGRKHVDFVVDNQPPIVVVKKGEMGEIPLAIRAVRHDLVGGDGHMADLFGVSAIFPDVRLGKGGLVQQFLFPWRMAVTLVVRIRVEV